MLKCTGKIATTTNTQEKLIEKLNKVETSHSTKNTKQ